MRALLIRQFGDPGQLRVEDVPTPVPQNEEVLVAVHASSINPSDVKNAAGLMHGTTLPRIPGRDFAGVVTRGPADLLGRAVFGTGGDLGFTRDGAHAEFILLPRAALTPKPPALSMDAAGAAGVTFITAWSAMVTAAHVGPGDTAVIIGAAGGVGSAAVQIAKSRGARIIAVVRSDLDKDTVRALGADEAVNSKSAPLIDSIRTLTAGHGAQIVFDTSGMMFAEAVESAALNARLPIITSPKDGTATFNLRTLYRKELRIVGVDTRRLTACACAALLAEMVPHFQSGRFTVPPSEPRPLEQAPSAYAQAAQSSRRILLRPAIPAGV